MIINPKVVLENQWIYSDNVPIEENQIQQAGIDLRLAKIERVVGAQKLSKNGNIIVPQLIELEVGTEGYWYLEPGLQYSITFIEECRIPSNSMALIIHRSSLNRFSSQILSGIMDPGFQSKGGCGATIRVYNPLWIEVGSRAAQIIFLEASAASLYNGQYQNT